MTQPDAMLLIEMQFQLYNDANVVEEFAQIGLWGDYDPITSPTDLQDAMDDLAAFALSSWNTDMTKSRFHQGIEAKAVKVVKQDTSGHTERESIAVPSGTPWRGTGSGVALPWESAMVIGLYTYPRGTFIPGARRRRGRVYMPGLDSSGLSGGHSGLLTSTYVSGILGDFKTFLGHLLTHTLLHGTSSWHPGVFSRAASQINEVVQLSADNKVDVHRSRERQQSATITNLAFP